MMAALGAASALRLWNDFIIWRQPTWDSQSITLAPNYHPGEREQSQRCDDRPMPRSRGGVTHLHTMPAFWQDQAPQQVVRAQNLSRAPVNRRLPARIVGLADDQDSALIRHRLDRQAVRFVTDDARIGRRLKLPLRQAERRLAAEFE